MFSVAELFGAGEVWELDGEHELVGQLAENCGDIDAAFADIEALFAQDAGHLAAILRDLG